MFEKELLLERIGWQEWCALGALNIPAIKAKIDTGAKTSAIHATNIEAFTEHGVLQVRFNVHPLQRNNEVKVSCIAPVVDRRKVMSSNGLQEERYVIKTKISMGDMTPWDIELTLSDRDPLRFRLLLGREALKNKVIINPEKLCCLTKLGANDLNELYYKNHPHKSKKIHAEF